MKNVKRIFSVAVLSAFAGFGAMAQCSDTEVIIDMFDSFGDGWNGNQYQIYDDSGNGALVASGTLAAGSVGADTLCLADDCYQIDVGVTGGSFDSEVSWEIVVGGNVIDNGGAVESSYFTIGSGVCIITGCTDSNALNYNPDATQDDGSCLYPSSNDLCEDAEEVECGDEVDGTTANATTDSGTPFCGTSVTSPGVWFQYEAAGEVVTYDLCTTNFDSKISVYSGDCDNLSCLGGNDDSFANCGAGNASYLENILTPDGEMIYILVHGFGGQTGEFTLNIECTEVEEVENDYCDDAEEVECGDEVDGTTLFAAEEEYVDGTTCGTFISAGGSWYVMEPSADELVTISTCGADYDSKISVFYGDDCDDLTCLGGNDDNFSECGNFDGSYLQLLCTDDNEGTWYILVHGLGSQQGNFTLSVECEEFEPVENDFCADAEDIECGDSIDASTEGAFPEDVAFCGTTSNTAPGVWYTFTGEGNCVTLDTEGSTYDTKLTLWSGDCDNLVCVDGDDDGGTGLLSLIEFTSVDGVDYFVQVHGFSSNYGEFTLNFDCEDPPANDYPDGAIDIAVGGSAPWDNTCSSADAGEVTPGPGTSGTSSCNSQDGWCSFQTTVASSLWYTFTAPASGCVSIGIDNTEDMQLAVWEVSDASDYSTYVELAGNDDSGPGLAPLIDQLSCLTAGATYYVQLDGYGSNTGSGNITVTDCGNDPLSVDAGECQSHFFGVAATDAIPNNYLSASGSGGFEPYSYSWSGPDIVGSANTQTIEVDPQTAGNIVYTVTITDAAGCTSTDEVIVYTQNVDCSNNSNASKALICHVPPGNIENPQNICVSVNSLDAHLGSNLQGLHGGDYFGECGNTCTAVNDAPPPCTNISVTLTTDNFGSETSFSLVGANSGEVLTLANGDQSSNTTVTYDGGCVASDDCYTFDIADSFGDGICCSWGTGSYSIDFGGSSTASPSGGAFGSSESVQVGACSGAKTDVVVGATSVATINAFPNPFSSTTNISFNLPSDEEVVVEVLTVAGERVAVLYNGQVAAGATMTVEFDGEGLADGIYFYRLSTESGAVQNGKLVLQH